MTANNNCLTCRTAYVLPDDIQGVLSLGTVAAFNTVYSVTINDQNQNIVYKSEVTSGAAGEMSITFGAESVGIFHHYFTFPLTATNLTTGEVDTITDVNGNTADCIELQFVPCDDTEGPYVLKLLVDRLCNCAGNCNCVTV